MTGKQRKPGYRPRVAGARPAPRAQSETPESTPVEPPVSDSAPDSTTEQLGAGADDGFTPVDSATTPVDSAKAEADPANADVSGADVSAADVPAADVSAPDTVSQTPPAEDDHGAAQATTTPGDAETAATASDAAADAGTETEVSKPAAKTRPVSRVSTLRPQSESVTSSRGEATPTTRASGRASRASGGSRGWFSTRALVVIAAVAAVAAIAAAILGAHPGVTIGSNKAFVEQSATTDLTAQVQTKICQAVAADGTKVDQWAATARTVLTGEALKQFNDYLPTQKQILNQSKAVADCRVDAVGVRELSGDSDGSTAVATVNLIISESVNGAATNSGTSANQLTLVKQGDQWLISKVGAI